MSEPRGVFIGVCGHPVLLGESGRLDACACDRPTTSSRRRRAHLAEHGAAVEEIERLRWTLEQIVVLADEVDADTITDAELRQRLAALADRARASGG